ncbi:MAG: polyphosphate kinase 1 [Chitinispirillaceae bacterium]
MKKHTKTFFTNRELSWLTFNGRILELARDKELPLLERLKFLSIVGSNLDEFFMVRVGGLQILTSENVNKPDPSGMTPHEQLDAISSQVHDLVKIQYRTYEEVMGQLKEAGIVRLRYDELNEMQSRHLETVFENEIFPPLSPIAVTPPNSFPLLLNCGLNMAVRLKGDKNEPNKPRYAVIPTGKNINRFISLPSDEGYRFMLLEDVISLFIERFFPGEHIMECIPFRMTRNADLGIREDLAFDLMAEMTAVLDARKRSDCVRLEISDSATKTLVSFLQKVLPVSQRDLYLQPGPLDLSAFMKFAGLKGFKEQKLQSWPPQPCPQIDPRTAIMDQLEKGKTFLLYHPYESFEPVVRFVEEASKDPDVITIKQILYRTSRRSPIVQALIRAAERGKYVTVIVELKARFDEQRNIEWARELEDAGVQVVYGVKGLKTHAKACMVIRKSNHGITRFMHFGTGNYNEQTAQLYCDVSFFTADEDLGADAASFFNAITGYSQPQKYRKIETSPLSLREKCLELIENEIESKRQGQKAFIRIKLNALADPELISALYRAAQAGVAVDLNIRSICCLQPGIPEVSTKISVTSIVDRFLEHSRILHFHAGGENKVYITTADWMPRNLDRRIELLIPIEDDSARTRLIDLISICLKDNTNAWKLSPDGTYERLKSGKKKSVRSQEIFYKHACNLNLQAKRHRKTVFEPYRPQSEK